MNKLYYGIGDYDGKQGTFPIVFNTARLSAAYKLFWSQDCLRLSSE